MKTAPLILLAIAGMSIGRPATAAAQGISISPTFGSFIPATDLRELRDEAEQRRLERASTLGLGFNVELGWLRGSVAYATGAELNERGISNQNQIGDGSILAVAADLVMRPLPRFIIQPYLLGGGGIKRQDYSYDDEALDDVFPSDRTNFTLHFGVGADLMLGSLGVMAEITDFLSRRPDDSFGQHDAFAMLGLRFRLGGR